MGGKSLCGGDILIGLDGGLAGRIGTRCCGPGWGGWTHGQGGGGIQSLEDMWCWWFGGGSGGWRWRWKREREGPSRGGRRKGTFGGMTWLH